MKRIIDSAVSWDKIGEHPRQAYTYSLGKATIAKEQAALTLRMELNFVLPFSDLENLKNRILEQSKGIREIKFDFCYKDVILSEEEIIRHAIEHMIDDANGQYALMTKTIFTEEFLLSEETLTLFALGDLVVRRLNKEVAPLFEGFLSGKFGITRRVAFRNHEEAYAKARAKKKTEEKEELERIQKKAESVKRAAPQSKEKEKGKCFRTKGKSSLFSPVPGEPLRLSEITSESGIVTVSGTIIKMDERTISTGKKLITFILSDNTSSMGVKGFLSEENYAELKSKIAVGDYIKLRGSAGWDQFENETLLTLKSIEKETAPVREDLCEEKRVELHAHTRMSNMDGLCDTAELIRQAAAWNHKAIAITDHGVCQAFPEAAAAVKKHKLDIKVLYGMEGYYFDDSDCLMPNGDIDHRTKKYNHIILLAKNQEGLRNLYKLVSKSHLNYFYKRPKLPRSVLSAHREGLLVGSACEAGELYRAVATGADSGELARIAAYYDYLEIQPITNNLFLIERGEAGSVSALQENNRKIVELGKQLGKPVVATCDAHYLRAEDAVFRTVLMAGQGYKDAEGGKGLYLRTTEEMLREFSYLGEEDARRVVIDAPGMIADMVEKIKPVPSEKFPPKIENADEILRTKCLTRAHEIYGDPLPPDIEERLERELTSIIGNGYAVMYVSAEMLVNKSLEDGYLVGSRGSVGSSFAATMAGITEVNPLPPHYICPSCKHFEWGDRERYDCGVDMQEKDCPSCGTRMNQDGFMIPFETFLGFEGDKEPDIDLNFAGEYQSVAHKYVEEIFGRENVFRAGTIGTIAAKTAYGFVRKYFEEKGAGVNKWEIERLTIGCTGVRRTTGQHPGGIIIVPEGHEIYEFCPVQHPANDTQTDIITTHFDYHSIAENLLKLDILGHDVPSMIRHLQDMTGVDPLTLPLKDEKVNSIFIGTEGLEILDPEYPFTHGSFGIPEFGTSFVRQMLDDTKPDKFAALVRISGFSHGTNVWINNAQDYIRNGQATMNDAISTRDDIMNYLILKGLPNKTAFKIMESVRKGKGVSEEEAELMREKKVPEWYIESCRKIEYMFPRAHAVAYVMMSYRIAWYKVYCPAAFYAAYFTTKANAFDAETVFKGAAAIRRKLGDHGLKGKAATQKDEDEATVLEVALEMLARGYGFLPARMGSSEASRFSILDGKVMLPLVALPGLGMSAAKAIAEECVKRPFGSVEELQMRTKANKTAIEALKAHGALEGIPESDQLSLF